MHIHAFICIIKLNIYFNMQMANELDLILDKTEAVPAASCRDENGSVSYLQRVICPIYETIVAVSGFFTLLLYCWFPMSLDCFGSHHLFLVYSSCIFLVLNGKRMCFCF